MASDDPADAAAATELARLRGVIARADDVLRGIAEFCPDAREASAFCGGDGAAVEVLLSTIAEARRILARADPGRDPSPPGVR